MSGSGQLETKFQTPLFQREVSRLGPLSVWVKFCQGVSALPGQHKDWAFSTLLLLYYSQVLGLPASYASIVLAISLIVDAFTDPMVGAYSDNLRSRLGRRHPLMMVSILPVCGAIYALFAPPQDSDELLLGVWMLVCTLCVRIGFTFYAVPWGAIAAELSQDYSERTSIVAYRMMIGGLGGVLFIFAIYSAFPASATFENGLFDPQNYQTFALVIAGLMFVWMTFSTLSTLNQVQYLPQPVGTAETTSVLDMMQRVAQAMGNKNFRTLFIATLIFGGVAGTGQVFDTYMNTFFWDFGPEDLRWFSFAFLGMAASFITIGPLQRRFEKRDIMRTSLLVMTLLQVLKVGLRFADLLPANDDPLLLPILVLHACVMGYCYFVMLMMFASMMADVVDEQEQRNGLRQEGIFSGGITFSAKATSSLGLVLGGFLLEHVISFPAGMEPGQVGHDVLVNMAIVDGIIVPALNIIPLVLISRYTLTQQHVMDIQSELRTRAVDHTTS